MKKVILVYVMTFIVCIFSQPVLADEHEKQEIPWEKFGLTVGGFVTSLDSAIQLGAGGIGLDLDLEEALGLDSNDLVFRVEALWRFTANRRHRAEFSWLGFRRDATRTLLEDIEIDDTIFPAGTTVNSSFDIDIFKGAYSYSFFQDDRFDLGAGLGLFVMPTSFDINATGGLLAESESITAPFPVLGLRGDFAVTPKVFVRSSLDVFYLQVGQFTGTLLNTKVAVEYKPFTEHKRFKGLSLGLGLDGFRARIESIGEDYPGVDFRGAIKFRYTGLAFYGRFEF